MRKYLDGTITNERFPKDEPTKVELLGQYLDELQSSDYKIIKCFEAFVSGCEMPYDLKELTTKREALRELIRKLE